MDCMDGMKEFPDKYFDLAIVSSYTETDSSLFMDIEQVR